MLAKYSLLTKNWIARILGLVCKTKWLWFSVWLAWLGSHDSQSWFYWQDKQVLWSWCRFRLLVSLISGLRHFLVPKSSWTPKSVLPMKLFRPPKNWQERLALQSVAVQAVDWHADSGPLFSLLFSSFLRHNLFSKKECSDQKTHLAKVDGSAQKPRSTPFSRPRQPFWGPLAVILDFWGSHRRNGRIKKLI